MVYSLIEIFGELPVHPDKFKTLDWKLKWMETPTEGEDFCTSCGTLTPHRLKTHHTDCVWYNPNKDEWTPEPNPLGNCPECGSEDGLSIDSSWELQLSTIYCIDCRYSFQDSICEEELIKRFKEV